MGMMKDTPMNEALIASGLTAKRVAKEMGISKSVLSTWMTGRTSVPVLKVSKLAIILGLTNDEMLSCICKTHEMYESSRGEI